MSYTAWSVIAGETPTATKWNELGSNDADFDSRLSDLEDKRVTSVASASSITPNFATTDIYDISALAANLTINAPSNTPTDGQSRIIRIKDNGNARTLTWNGTYRVVGTTLPSTTVAGKQFYAQLVWNANDSVWDVVAAITQS